MNIFERQKGIFTNEEMARLRASTILVAGLGGLGSFVAEGLVRLGIGGLILVDDDRVSDSDLNRQILYTAEDLGEFKARAARKRLLAIRDDIWLDAWVQRITPKFDIPNKVNGVVDALDNWESRFVLEEICQKKNKFLVHAGLSGVCGQLTSIVPGKTPRLSEIFKGAKDESPAAFFSICAVLGALQVYETAKLLCQHEDTLAGKLLLVDLKTYGFEIVPLAK
ncbi:HesA/MoeB/ThiF family protein [Thermodesulfatator atlanticus]|uniref:HesA/MoeB/ThiF family protein n=1 Tax=Thermodesulfatator atlanticus TaxID=501497 RepID=UPI0003B5B732|nr:ThiF family adenylyltransferase [Thermodesulfatator atlanticus]